MFDIGGEALGKMLMPALLPLLLIPLGLEPMLVLLLLAPAPPNCDDIVAAEDMTEVDCGCERSGGVTRKEGLLLSYSDNDLLNSSSSMEGGPLRDPRYLVDERSGDLFVGVSDEGDGVGEGEDMQSYAVAPNENADSSN
jgi:hypothetical protein